MRYFENVQSIEEAKKVYKKYLFLLHPDTSGRDSNKDFLEFMNQWENLSIQGFNEQEKDSFVSVINELERLPQHINIDIVGCFIWLTGTIYTDAQTIKSIKLEGYRGPFWAKNKQAWYYSPEGYAKKTGKNFELEEIKAKYGHTRYKAKGVFSLA